VGASVITKSRANKRQIFQPLVELRFKVGDETSTVRMEISHKLGDEIGRNYQYEILNGYFFRS
jgi:hypothetical protein